MTAKTIISYLDDFAHLFFPHNCAGCGTNILENKAVLCAACLEQLPETGFIPSPGNHMEKIFYGRMQVEHAASAFYFTKDSLMHHLMIELKYHGNKEIGFFCGKLLGLKLAAAARYKNIEIIVPLPLNEKKEKRRGYNQATLITKGIAEVWNKPIAEYAMGRSIFTQTQTHKDRVGRWQNMEGVFTVDDQDLLRNKHVLLIDDVITTGATLEACGMELLKVEGTKLSIATVAYTL
ncbi:MAG: phosphoribosyltransferase family protein [Parafilimonas sp.]